MTDSTARDGHVCGTGEHPQPLYSEDLAKHTVESLSAGIQALTRIARAGACSVAAGLPRFDVKDFLEELVNVCFLPFQGIQEGGRSKALLAFLARRFGVRLGLAAADDRPLYCHSRYDTTRSLRRLRSRTFVPAQYAGP